MIINKESYVLPASNYIQSETKKSNIILGHTFNTGMKHFNGWRHRYNGKYQKTAHYTIDVEGMIYQHIEPQYYTKHIQIESLNKSSIVILLENEGWLNMNVEKNNFSNWIGDIYYRTDKVSIKRWRNHLYWAQYDNRQIEAAVELSKKLCDEFSIPRIAFPHNTRVDDLEGFNGILYKSNIKAEYTDLSPAWNCEDFKSRVETKLIKNEQ